jgi:hypothetical protein
MEKINFWLIIILCFSCAFFLCSFSFILEEKQMSTKGKGKGVYGIGKGGVGVRHRKVLRENINGIPSHLSHLSHLSELCPP